MRAARAGREQRDAVLSAWLDSVELVLARQPLKTEDVRELLRIGHSLFGPGEEESGSGAEEFVKRIPEALESLCVFKHPSQTLSYVTDRSYLHEVLVRVALYAQSHDAVIGEPVLDVSIDPDEGDSQLVMALGIAGNAEDALAFLSRVDRDILIPSPDVRVRTHLLIKAVPHE